MSSSQDTPRNLGLPTASDSPGNHGLPAAMDFSPWI